MRSGQPWFHPARGIEPPAILRAPAGNRAGEGRAWEKGKRQEKSPPKRAFLYVGDFSLVSNDLVPVAFMLDMVTIGHDNLTFTNDDI